ncbi:MAG TPA: hypothetical protein DCR63_07425 [Microbacterium sp.]|nr:hypothetical protein [Microbacterium sp.]
MDGARPKLQQPERVVDRDEVGAFQRGCRQQRPFAGSGPRVAKQGDGFIDAGERIAPGVANA